MTGDDRPFPETTAGELETLHSFLRFHRATLEWKCEGLSPEQLCERSAPPSPMSLAGIVRHLADVERGWFRRGMGGQEAPPVFWDRENPDGDFEDSTPETVDADMATWRAECAAADEVIRGADLDAVITRQDETLSHRWVLVHMVEEYARHNGHADLLRERIDGGAVGE